VIPVSLLWPVAQQMLSSQSFSRVLDSRRWISSGRSKWLFFSYALAFHLPAPHRSLRVRPMLVRTKCDTIHFLATRLPYTRPFLLSFRPDSWLTAHLTINSSLSPSQKILSFPKTPSSPIFFTFALSKSSKPPIPPFPIPMPSITRQGLVYHSQRLQIPI
jgi:hypothetical protein